MKIRILAKLFRKRRPLIDILHYNKVYLWNINKGFFQCRKGKREPGESPGRSGHCKQRIQMPMAIADGPKPAGVKPADSVRRRIRVFELRARKPAEKTGNASEESRVPG